MRVIQGWEQAAAYEDGAERVPAGGHVCRIVLAKVETIQNGSEKLSLALDIAEGSPLDGVYRRTFERRSGKWPCVFGQFLTDRDGQCSPYFKGLIKCVEKSNPGYAWTWDESTLNGKLVGMIFREEEFEDRYGGIRTTTRPAFARTVDRIREGVDVPEVKRLSAGGFVEAQDEGLPF